jgi:hypothetical protein
MSLADPKKPPVGGFFMSAFEMLNERLADYKECKDRAAPKSAGDSAALMTHTGMSLR